MRRNSLQFLIVLTVCAIPLSALAYINLTSMGGKLFDIRETTDGALNNGTSDAYDGCYYLTVNGTRYSRGSATHTTTAGGRHVHMPEVAVGALRVQRHIYVPAAGGEYARYIDVIRNPSAMPVTTTAAITGNLGSDSSTVTTSTSSGDLAITTADHWFGTDDSGDGSGDPSLAHLFHAPGALVTPTAVSRSRDSINITYMTTIPAMGEVAFMTFAIQESNRAASHAEAMRVMALPADALADADAYVGNVVNFPIGGAPLIRFTAPDSVMEGEPFMIEVEVTDREGDAATWSWDTDGDMMFGESADMATLMIPAGTTDGDSSYDVSVESSDGMNTRIASVSVAITNVEPTITSTPPATAQIRRVYEYTPVIEDPAAALDPLEFELIQGPDGLVMDTMGTITWTPEPDVRAMTFPVEFTVRDGDGGSATQMWDVMVSENTPPSTPVLVSPIDQETVTPEARVPLILMNATDPDGDALSYYFRLDQRTSFASENLMESSEVMEDASGMTQWMSPRTLNLGLWYWQAWSTDGIDESERVFGQFIVRRPVPDASVPMGPDGGNGQGDASTAPPFTPTPSSGCSMLAPAADTTSSRGGLATFCLGLLGLVWTRRRRG